MSSSYDNFAERVREQADIVRIIGEYAPLKKAGARYRALCPFHDEKTPSFFVNPVKGLFHCFGCGVGGDVFAFVMKMERVEFPEALRIVAEKLGIPVPEKKPRAPGDFSTGDFYDVYEEASKFYIRNLWENPIGETARSYLENRGVGKSAAERLKLGYALPQWDGLCKHLKGKGFAPALIEKAGLARKSAKDSHLYDFFRNRLLFPIHTTSGKTIAFGGRAIEAKDDPKYINSPEHPAYNKGRTLYGIYFSRDEIAKKGVVILVEGYFDFLRLYQEDIKNIAAICGTGFTPGHASLLRRYSAKVLVNFDSDPAGTKATLSAISSLMEKDLQSSVLRLPDGTDPDDYVRTKGREAYLEKIQKASPAVEFLIEELAETQDLRTPRGKIDALNSLLPYLAKIPSIIERTEYVALIRDRLGIENSHLAAEIKRHLEEQKITLEGNVFQMAQAPTSLATTAERMLLISAIENTENFLHAITETNLTTDEFQELITLKNIWTAIFQRIKAGKSVSFSVIFKENIPEEEKTLISFLGTEEYPPPAPNELKSAIESLKKLNLSRSLKIIQKEIERAEKEGDKERLETLIRQKMAMSRKISLSSDNL